MILTLIIPLPAVLAAIYIIPRMVTRYLLVRSLSSVDLNALDSVVEVRSEKGVGSCFLSLSEGEKAKDETRRFTPD